MRVVENPQTHLKTLQKLIADERKKAATAKLQFTGPDDDQLIEKLRRAQSPMIIWQGWSGQAPAGGTITYTVGIYNPDPIHRSSLYAHVFVGPANLVANTGEALATADSRFGNLTEPPFFGFSLAPGASTSLTFALKIPAVAPSNYLGNTFLFQADYHDVGTYLDRGCFPFKVV